MPDRRTDYEARERIERLHAAYVAFARRVFVALTIITLAVVASLALVAAWGMRPRQGRSQGERGRMAHRRSGT
jgi:hypothetical protein